MSHESQKRIVDCPDCFGTGICEACKGEGGAWTIFDMRKFFGGAGTAGQKYIECTECPASRGVCPTCAGYGFVKGVETADSADGFQALPEFFDRVNRSRGSRWNSRDLLSSAGPKSGRGPRRSRAGSSEIPLLSQRISEDSQALSPPAIRNRGLPEVDWGFKVPDAFRPAPLPGGTTGRAAEGHPDAPEGGKPSGNSICVGGLWSWVQREEILHRTEPQPPEDFEQILDEADKAREKSGIDFLAWYSSWARNGDSGWGIYFDEGKFLSYVLSASRRLTSLDEADYLIPALFHEVLIHELVHLRVEIALTELWDLMAIDPRTYNGLRPNEFPASYYETFRDLECIRGLEGPFEEAIATASQVEWASEMESVDPDHFSGYGKYVGARHRKLPGYRDFELCLGADAREAAAACLVSRVVQEHLALEKQVRDFETPGEDREDAERVFGSVGHLPLRSGRWLTGQLDLEQVPVYWNGHPEIAEWLGSLPVPAWSWRWAESGAPGVADST